MIAARTMLFRECDGVLLCVHTAASPGPEEWQAYIDFCVRLPPTCNRTLVVTRGGGPDAMQRKALQDRYLSARARNSNVHLVAVMTDSPFVRGIVKALNWHNPGADSFPYDEGRGVRAAVVHLKLDPSFEGRLRMALDVMTRELRRLSETRVARLEPAPARRQGA